MDNKHNEKELNSSQSAVEDSEEEENEILEESPCGRWHKRREEVEQNNIPGIDATYLAMDTEEGVEVVWNEVRFSERKYFKAKEEIISEVFDRLIQLEHPNIVKLHKYWIHKDADIPKVVFITEYMSSGSLKQYFEKTKRHDIKISLQVWRRWCTQTLSALCYLHSSQPSIIHGNINCDTIFISYNGLIKIGAIAPDAIHRHVKTVRADAKTNLHFIAPELVNVQQDHCQHCLSPAVDIYSFGMCALEMAALEIPTDNDSTNHISEDSIHKTIESLDISLQKDFIKQCLRKEPDFRPSARDLLFHPIIFEVPSLKLFCAHSILNNPSLQPEQLTEDAISRLLCLQNQNDRIVIEIKKKDQPSIIFKQSDFPNRELEKWLDEVKNGAFPLTAVMPTTRPPLVSRQRTISPEIIDNDSHQNRLINTPDNPYDEETRRIVYMSCSLQPIQQSEQTLSTLPLAASFFDVKIVIKLDDKINRQLTCEISKDQLIPNNISQELVYYGFINKEDKENVAQLLIETLNKISQENSLNSNPNSNVSACCEKYFQQFQQQQQQLHHHQKNIIVPVVVPSNNPNNSNLSNDSNNSNNELHNLNNNSPNNNHNNNNNTFVVQQTTKPIQQQQPLINFEHSVDNSGHQQQQLQQNQENFIMINHHQNGGSNNNDNHDNNDVFILNNNNDQQQQQPTLQQSSTKQQETFPDSTSSS